MLYEISLHRICTAEMASIRKQKSGSWRVQVRREGRSVSENFVRHEDAKRWSIDAERQIDRGESPHPSSVGRLKTFGDLIDLHISDMSDVGKAPRRSKAATLEMLKRELGRLNMMEDLCRTIEQHEIRPVIDSVFAFDDAKAGWSHYGDRQVGGKAVFRH